MKVFRYELKVTDHQVLDLPLSATVLSVAPGRTGYHIDCWALVPEEAPDVPYVFHVVGTGNPMMKVVQDFVGTAVMSNGLVWHVFVEPSARGE